MAAVPRPNNQQQAPNQNQQQQQEPVKYTCAACLAEQTLAFDRPLLCNACSSRSSTSRIFFKKRRTEATLYDTN